MRNIRIHFKQQEEKDYFKPIRRVGNFWNNNCIKYESSGDRKKKTVSKIILKEQQCSSYDK